MKKLLLTCGIALMAVFSMTAQAQNENAAEITFESETIDYGTIVQGSNGAREFKFTNTGKEPLIISNCKGSCGCTVPNCPKEPIAPGESGVIKVKYDTKRLGAFTKTITVKSNSKTPSKIVRIKGKVEAKPAEQTTPTKEHSHGSPAVK